MAKAVYCNDFDCAEDVFGAYDVPEKEMEGVEIVFADYTYEDYSGSSHVIFKKNGSFYEVYGSHCSCYGLEGQWEPELIDTETYRARMERTGEKDMIEVIEGWF